VADEAAAAGEERVVDLVVAVVADEQSPSQECFTITRALTALAALSLVPTRAQAGGIRETRSQRSSFY
jgi:hypothetical protein